MFEQTIIVGRLGQDPETKFLASGKQLCTFSVATSRWYKDSSGEFKENTKWWRVTVWEPRAERCSERLSKGDLVQITGEIAIPRVYQGSDGSAKSAGLELTARNILFLSTKKSAKKQEEEEFDL